MIYFSGESIRTRRPIYRTFVSENYPARRQATSRLNPNDDSFLMIHERRQYCKNFFYLDYWTIFGEQKNIE